MSKPKLSEIRAREQAATEGPWTVEESHIMATEGEYDHYDLMGAICCKKPQDLDFVACARSDIPHLLDLVNSLRGALEPFARKERILGCDFCLVTMGSDKRIKHQHFCAVLKARNLLDEVNPPTWPYYSMTELGRR